MTLTLTRTLHLTTPLQHGVDVTAAQTLLTAKGFPVEVDGWFGPETAAACVTAKKRLGYAKADQTPTCGQALVNTLEPLPPFPPPKTPPARTRYLTALRSALTDKARWDYRQIRPIPHPPHAGRIVTDCSGGVTYLAELAGVPDPNGRRFDGLGYTGTLLDHCRQVTRAMLAPGDLVVFGSYPGHHVTAVLETGPDPLLWSHGHQGDPGSYRLSAMAAAQPPGVTYLRFLP